VDIKREKERKMGRGREGGGKGGRSKEVEEKETGLRSRLWNKKG